MTSDRLEKFTERARKVLTLAQEEAQRFNHNYIGTEHLLLGLVREGEGVAARVLANLGINLNQVRTAVEFIIGRGDRVVASEIGLTPRAKKVIELAVDEARRLNHHYLGTEHLLLGLVREGEGIAAGVLESLGVNLEKVRQETIRVLSQSGAIPHDDAKDSPSPTIDQRGSAFLSDLAALMVKETLRTLDDIITEKVRQETIRVLSRSANRPPPDAKQRLPITMNRPDSPDPAALKAWWRSMPAPTDDDRTRARKASLPVVTVDFGGTQIRVALIDQSAQLTARYSVPTEAILGRDAVIDRIVGAVETLLAQNGLTPADVLGLGVSSPGPLNGEAGIIFMTPNLPGWIDVPLRDILQARLGMPTFMENDAILAAVGERTMGAGVGADDLLYITVSTGIGGGIIEGGHVLRGVTGTGGHIGHMIIEPDGPPCNCGNHGCLEALASGTGLAKRAVAELHNGAESSLRAMVNGDLTQVTGVLVGEAAQQGDPLAVRLVTEAATYLGLGIVSLLHILNPEIVIIGGGVTNLGPLLFDPMERVIQERAMRVPREAVKIVPAGLGDDAGLVGAAVLVRRKLGVG